MPLRVHRPSLEKAIRRGSLASHLLTALGQFSALLLILGCLLATSVPLLGAEELSNHAITLNLLESRRKQQVAAAQKYQAFHGFKFTDRISESGITFAHQIVDDAGKEYKAAHYDHGNGLAVADVDGDGMVDIYFTTQLGANQLWRNLGGGKFQDVSKEMNLRDGSWSGDATFADLNQDRFPDLYVVNMQGDNHYYENQGDKGFIDKTAAYFPKTPWGAMGVKFFDFNQDGLMDVYITDMHSDMTKGQTVEALNFRIEMEKTKSEAFCSVQWTEAYLQGSTNNIFGNAFYQNLGGGKFAEVSDRLGVETYWPWGVSVGDLNADGFEDIFVASGMGYPFRYGINPVLMNEGGKGFFGSEFLVGVEPRGDRRTEKPWFTLDCDGADKQHPECAGKSGKTVITGTLSTRSSAFFDLDNDGDLDVVTNEFNDRPQLLVSNLTEAKRVRSLKIKLKGVRSNRDGLGATVIVRAGGKRLTQFHDGKSGYLSKSSMPLYFGLGEATGVESVEVLWPSGKNRR